MDGWAMKQEWEKILVDGKSCNGGKLTWSLPHKENGTWVPGDWHTVDGDLEMCERGIHVTKQPFMWYRWGCERYACEVRGIMPGGDKYKTLVRSARLLRPLPHPQWWLDAIQFVSDIPKVRWFQPDGKPLKSWRLFEANTLSAARTAAHSAARIAAHSAARIAAHSAAHSAASAAAHSAAHYTAYCAAYNGAYYAAYCTVCSAAHDAARDAARGAAYDATYSAARIAASNVASNAASNVASNAALAVVALCVCADTSLSKKHRHHAAARWQVWQKGYCLLCDVDGVLYVYAQKR